MPLLDTEVNVEIRNLLINEWASNQIVVTQPFDTAWISTGWWNEDTPNPQITLTVQTEPTDPDGLTPTGLSSWVDGFVQCDVWIPYESDTYESQGLAKEFRWDLTRKVHSIIEQNQQGTVDSDGNPVLTRLETGVLERNPTDSAPPFRMMIPVGYQYRTAPY